MPKVESYEIRGRDGRLIRVVNYYSIHEIRKLYNQFLQELEKQKQTNIYDSFHVDIVTINDNLFLKSDLRVWNGNAILKNIVMMLPIKKEILEDNIEFAKLITRLEKKSKIMILALEDPDEAKGEIEDIENVVTQEEEVKEEIKQEIKEEMITPAQMRVIANFVNNDVKLMQSLGEFMSKNFNKHSLKDLTKAEASKVISLWMNSVKKE